MADVYDKLRTIQVRLRDHADWLMYRAAEVLGHLVATRQYKPGVLLALDEDLVRMVLCPLSCARQDVADSTVARSLRFLQRQGVDMSAGPLTTRRVRDIISADTASLVEEVDRDITESGGDLRSRVYAHFELREYGCVLALLADLDTDDEPRLLGMKMVAALEEGQPAQALCTCEAWLRTMSDDGAVPPDVAFESFRVKGIASAQMGHADDFLAALQAMFTIVEIHEAFGGETGSPILLLTQRPGFDLCLFAERFVELARAALTGIEVMGGIDQGMDQHALGQIVRRLVDLGERAILEFPFPMLRGDFRC